LPDLILVLAALTAAQAHAAGPGALIKPTAPAGIASAVGDCWRAVGPNGVDRSALAAAGWSPALFTAEDKAASPLEPFGKAGANHMIMLVKDPAKPLCTVIARASSQDDARSALDAIKTTLQSVAAGVKLARSGDGVAFLSLPRLALVDEMTGASGTEEQPGLRIVVAYQDPEKK
jgi:hypothetical protein